MKSYQIIKYVFNKFIAKRLQVVYFALNTKHIIMRNAFYILDVTFANVITTYKYFTININNSKR